MKARASVFLVLAVFACAQPAFAAAKLPTPNDIPGLKRTNQVLALVIAFLKLVDEIGQLPDPGDIAPMPPPIGTGHPGPLPGPLPVTLPDVL